MSDRYAIVRDRQIENVVLWDGETDWQCSDGATVMSEAEAIKAGYAVVPTLSGVPTERPTTVDPVMVTAVADAVSKATTVTALTAALAPFFADLREGSS